MDGQYCRSVLSDDPNFQIKEEYASYIIMVICEPDDVRHEYLTMLGQDRSNSWMVDYINYAYDLCTSSWEEAQRQIEMMEKTEEEEPKAAAAAPPQAVAPSRLKFTCTALSQTPEGFIDHLGSSLRDDDARGEVHIVTLCNTTERTRTDPPRGFAMRISFDACSTVKMPQGVMLPKSIGAGTLFVPLAEELGNTIMRMEKSQVCDKLRKAMTEDPDAGYDQVLNQDDGFVGFYTETPPGRVATRVWLVVRDHHDRVAMQTHANMLLHLRSRNTLKAAFMEDRTVRTMQSTAQMWREHVAQLVLAQIVGGDGPPRFSVPTEEDVRTAIDRTFTDPAVVQNGGALATATQGTNGAFHMPSTSITVSSGQSYTITYCSEANLLHQDVSAVVTLDSLAQGYLMYHNYLPCEVTQGTLGTIPAGGRTVDDGKEIDGVKATFCGADPEAEPVFAYRREREGGLATVANMQASGVNHAIVPTYLRPMVVFCGRGYNPKRTSDDAAIVQGADADDLLDLLTAMQLTGDDMVERLGGMTTSSGSAKGNQRATSASDTDGADLDDF